MRWRTRYIVLGLLGLGLTGPAKVFAQPATLPPLPPATARPPFELHWMVGLAGPMVPPPWIDSLDRDADLTGTGITRDRGYLLGEANFGLFPRNGPGEFLLDPGLITRHRAEIRRYLDILITDRNFSGPVIIDYESWPFRWHGPMTEYRTHWENSLRTVNPTIFNGLTPAQKEKLLQERWEEAAKLFCQQTIDECKLRRPNAKFGFYGWPIAVYYDHALNVRLPEIGYGDFTNLPSRLDDRIQWLYDMSDIIVPSPYVFLQTIPAGQEANIEQFTNIAAHQHQYIASNIAESRRVGRGKPVYAVMFLRYQETMPTPWRLTYLNDEDMRLIIEAPWDAGAAGVFIWDDIQTRPAHNRLLEYVRTTLRPAVMGVNSRIDQQRGVTPPPGSGPGVPPPIAQPATAPPSGGSSGGGGGGGGVSGGSPGGPARLDGSVTGAATGVSVSTVRNDRPGIVGRRTPFTQQELRLALLRALGRPVPPPEPEDAFAKTPPDEE